MVKIILKYGGNVRGEFPLTKAITTIGRHPSNDIVIDNLAVSRHHAHITTNDKLYRLEDLQSNNGTFLQGERIHEYALKNGDCFTIGKHDLQFVTTLDFSEVDQEDGALAKSPLRSAILDPNEEGTVLIKAPPAGAAPTPGVKAQQEISGAIYLFAGSRPLQSQRSYFEIKNTATIGSGATTTIRLNGWFIPEIIAHIQKKKDGFFISPRRGWVQIKLNGAKIPAPQKLNDGDLLTVRSFVFQFKEK